MLMKYEHELRVPLSCVQTPAVNTVAADPFPGETRPEPGSKSLADADSSLAGAIGGAAVDWASRNPENAQAAAGFAFNAAKENPELAAKAAKAMV